jgi:hypothetical protein
VEAWLVEQSYLMDGIDHRPVKMMPLIEAPSHSLVSSVSATLISSLESWLSEAVQPSALSASSVTERAIAVELHLRELRSEIFWRDESLVDSSLRDFCQLFNKFSQYCSKSELEFDTDLSRLKLELKTLKHLSSQTAKSNKTAIESLLSSYFDLKSSSARQHFLDFIRRKDPKYEVYPLASRLLQRKFQQDESGSSREESLHVMVIAAILHR